MRKTFKSILLLSISALLGNVVSAAEPIGLAGVYECNSNPESIRKQMYLTIDFINGDVPDFTQVFTTKESSFQLLPKDFMNAKKLKKYFVGQKAPGFGKYNSKYLFSNTSEFKLTNPRIKDGVIMADWVDHDGAKGECSIIVNPDRTIQILGLTELTRDFSPDNITLTMVQDKLPEGMEPYVTPQAVASFVLKEAEKRVAKPKVTSFDKEIELKVNKARQIGNKVEIEMKMRNKSNYESLTITVCQDSGDKSFAVDSNGKGYTHDDVYARTLGSHGGYPAVKAEKGKWVPFTVIVDNVEDRPDWFKKVGIFFCIAGGFFMDNHIGLIEKLPVFQEMPEEIKPGYPEGSASAGKPQSHPAAADTKAVSASKVKLPVLYGLGGVQYKSHVRNKGGDYGYFTTDGIMDFWEEDGNGINIAGREYVTTVYDSGRIYENEYIYKGHSDGYKIVFTSRMDSMNGGQEEKIDPIVLEPTSDGKGFTFNNLRYSRSN